MIFDLGFATRLRRGVDVLLIQLSDWQHCAVDDGPLGHQVEDLFDVRTAHPDAPRARRFPDGLLLGRAVDEMSAQSRRMRTLIEDLLVHPVN